MGHAPPNRRSVTPPGVPRPADTMTRMGGFPLLLGESPPLFGGFPPLGNERKNSDPGRGGGLHNSRPELLGSWEDRPPS
eukprot:1194796-Prorocentrum_minimum.AAC.3